MLFGNYPLQLFKRTLRRPRADDSPTVHNAMHMHIYADPLLAAGNT